MRLINSDFNDMFIKYKHEKKVRTKYNRYINYSEYKNINFILSDFKNEYKGNLSNILILNVKREQVSGHWDEYLLSNYSNVYALELFNFAIFKKINIFNI